MSPPVVALALAVATVLFATDASAAVEEDLIKPNFDYETYKLYDIRGGLVLSCDVKTTEKEYVLKWLKDGKSVAEEKSLKDRYRIIPSENKFIIERTVENDAGNYTCEVGDSKADITVVAKPSVRLPQNTNVVEGEKLRLHCQAQGKPTPVVEWTIGNQTYNESTDRISLMEENGVENAILIISDITLEDRGDYYCRAINIANKFVNTTSDSTFVRVKDNLAALWPFLGICAEVFVLCAIILIYEKRRTKPEMDESDTDQSPDQKHTPDHGKDRDIRQRK